MGNEAAVVNLHDEGNGKADYTAGTEIHPFSAAVTITGIAPFLFHRWDCAEVEAKGKAAKNSRAKKTDNLESYVYRCDDGTLGVPGVNMKACLVQAARSKSDPRSSRKSAMELVKAIILVNPVMGSFGKKAWDFEDRRRAVIQRSGITRTRPAMREGWTLKWEILVLDPSYMDEPFLYDLVASAGRYVGIGDFRPQFGRFNVTHFKRISLR